MSWSYLVALCTDVIGILVALYFILSDAVKYPDHSRYGLLGVVTLAFAAWTGLSYYLYFHGYPGIASSMAWFPAVPLLGYGLMILMFIILKPDMK